jgi:hypothetical protein
MKPNTTSFLPLVLSVLFACVGEARAANYLGLIGGTGGTPFDGGCPPDQNLGGFELRVDNPDISAIRPVCVVSLGPREISMPPVQPPFFGGARGGTSRLICPSHKPIVIRVGVIATGKETITVADIELYCGLAVPDAQATDVRPDETYRSNVRIISMGGKEPSTVQGVQQCPAGQVAIGVHGRSGDWLDAMGLICGAPRLIAPHVGGVPRLPGDRAIGLGDTTVPTAPEKKLGRVEAPFGTGNAPRPICDVAREARARNSPAAPGLESQCRANLASRGEAIAMRDPLSAELRRRASNDASRRGFDIGMAAAEKDTAPGPGKQAIHNALGGLEQAAFDAAVSFSLQRNANAQLAATGAAIARADSVVARARTADPDVFFWLGFDIATGIFGDRKLGALGNTATGPGSARIRDALNPAAQRGFNSAVTLHLSRRYK